MKNFSLGFIIGAAIGVGISFLKNPETDKTIKHELKEYFDETNQDMKNLATASSKLKNSVSNFKIAADNSTEITQDIQKRLDHFSRYANRKLNKMNKNAAMLENKLNTLENNISKSDN